MQTYQVEIYIQSQHYFYGLIDHYFLVIDDVEYHLGKYKKGTVLPKGTTKGSHLMETKTICEDCYLKIQTNHVLKEYTRMWSLFPIINCETVTTGFSLS